MTETQPPASEVILYQTEDGRTRTDCRFGGDNHWLARALTAALFPTDVRTDNEQHVDMFAEGELSPEATIRHHRIVRTEGIRTVRPEISRELSQQPAVAVPEKMHPASHGRTVAATLTHSPFRSLHEIDQECET